MEKSVIEGYVDKIYAYAVKRTYSREEADELSQEILYTLVRELPRLKDQGRFEAWLWGVAGNVTKAYRRYMGRQRAMYYYDAPEDAYGVYEEDFAGEAQEREALYGRLRERIAMLSSIYRDIIILYYYEGLSTRQIAGQLGIPEGTVTWRLARARKKLKKECGRKMEESALRPVKMGLGIYGSGDYGGKVPFPSEYIKDALSQSILYHCYEQPRGVEELAGLCGVPAYYVEERVENLLKREAVSEPAKGKYQTDFIIWQDFYGQYCEENAERAMMPVMEKMAGALKGMAQEAGAIDFYKAGKPEGELFYLYGSMAFHILRHRYCRLPYPKQKVNYDGNCWNYMGYMETGKYHRPSVGEQHCESWGDRSNYSHSLYSFYRRGYRPMMTSDLIGVCEDILVRGETEEKDAAARAIQQGYLERRTDGTLFVKSPAFTVGQKKQFDEIVEKHFAPLMDEYEKAVEGFTAGYKKLFPKHLQEEADRACSGMFVGLFEVIAGYLQRRGEIPEFPSGSVCDVLLQFREPGKEGQLKEE